MTLFSSRDRHLASAIGELSFSNPFLTERVALERRILGLGYVRIAEVWSSDPRIVTDNPNVAAIRRLAEKLSSVARERLAAGIRPTEAEWRIYDALVLHVLFYRFEDEMFHELDLPPSPGRCPYYRRFVSDATHFLAIQGAPLNPAFEPAHLFALVHQFRRAFHFTFRRILGGSLAAARLRASVWQSIFTRDMRTYRRSLHSKMHEFQTLIVGPSGSGKELVASAIGLSRYIPFDARTERFAEPFYQTYRPINVAALPATLVESELFGHCKGAFTSAVVDREGRLENCGQWHTVFLDEVGEIDPVVQVKLLRLLQNRTFERVGENQTRRFGGKFAAATNRCLADDVQKGRFREDLYYRLCADVVVTPSLGEQVADDPDELARLVRFTAVGLVGDAQADDLADEVTTWILSHLPHSYSWPGNMRELEQCVRSVVVRGEYRPIEMMGPRVVDIREVLASCNLSAEELVQLQCEVSFAQTGSYCETGRLLGLDRRTVASRLSRPKKRKLPPKR